MEGDVGVDIQPLRKLLQVESGIRAISVWMSDTNPAI